MPLPLVPAAAAGKVVLVPVGVFADAPATAPLAPAPFWSVSSLFSC